MKNYFLGLILLFIANIAFADFELLPPQGNPVLNAMNDINQARINAAQAEMYEAQAEIYREQAELYKAQSDYVSNNVHTVRPYTRKDGTYVPGHLSGNPGSGIHCHHNVCN